MAPRLLISALALLSFAAAAPASAEMTRAEVETIVKEYIEKNPQIIMDSARKYQEAKMAEQQVNASKAVKEKSKELTTDKDSPVAGNPKGDVTVVEFFDYHCGYCKRALPAIEELLKNDKNVKVVFKEYPILSPDSELAAKAGLGVWRLKPEKYFEFHKALMQHTGKYDEAMLVETAKKFGVDGDKLKKEIASDAVQKIIEKDRALGTAIGVRGTPAFVIGDTLLPGAVPYEALKSAVDAARKKKK